MLEAPTSRYMARAPARCACSTATESRTVPKPLSLASGATASVSISASSAATRVITNPSDVENADVPGVLSMFRRAASVQASVKLAAWMRAGAERSLSAATGRGVSFMFLLQEVWRRARADRAGAARRPLHPRAARGARPRAHRVGEQTTTKTDLRVHRIRGRLLYRRVRRCHRRPRAAVQSRHRMAARKEATGFRSRDSLRRAAHPAK